MKVTRSALLPLPAPHLYAVIEDAEAYPQFLPWCVGATVLSRDDAHVRARLEVRWSGVRYAFVTRNAKRAPTAMDIALEQGPFRRFEGRWRLSPIADAGCRVEFMLDWEFDARFVGALAAPLAGRAVETLVDAFVRRAESQPRAEVAVAPLRDRMTAGTDDDAAAPRIVAAPPWPHDGDAIVMPPRPAEVDVRSCR